jgi:hypothetical protein
MAQPVLTPVPAVDVATSFAARTDRSRPKPVRRRRPSRRCLLPAAAIIAATVATVATAGTPGATRLLLQPGSMRGLPVIQAPTALTARDLAERFGVPTALGAEDAAIGSYSAGGRRVGIDRLLSLVIVFPGASQAHKAWLRFVPAPGGGSVESVEHVVPPPIGDEAAASVTTTTLTTFHHVQVDVAWRYKRAVVFMDAQGDAQTTRSEAFAIARAQQRRLAAGLR